MRTPTWRFTVRDALVAVALLGLIAAGARLLWPEPPPPRLSDGARLRVPTQPLCVTAVGFFRRTPPPWPAGNCFELSPLPLSRRAKPMLAQGYHVANMHYENFEEVVKRLGLKAVEVEYIGGCFLVVDTRIPRRWRREGPCPTCIPASIRDALLKKHAEKFR
jgi:hypothetical protein